MISIIILPQNNAVAANLTLDEVSYIVTEYLKLDDISENFHSANIQMHAWHD